MRRRGGWRKSNRGSGETAWPQVTRALLIGGDGDGWVIPVVGSPGLTESVFVTMVDGIPQEMYDVRRDERLWEQACGNWRHYRRIKNLPPDGFGWVGYWFTGGEGRRPR